jgi:prefoldin subunit 2
MASSNTVPHQIIQQFRTMLQEQEQMSRKIQELEMDRNEHQLVHDALQPLEPSRRAYRLVGEVLVERTVGEVLPSVEKNKQNVSVSCDCNFDNFV